MVRNVGEEIAAFSSILPLRITPLRLFRLGLSSTLLHFHRLPVIKTQFIHYTNAVRSKRSRKVYLCSIISQRLLSTNSKTENAHCTASDHSLLGYDQLIVLCTEYMWPSAGTRGCRPKKFT